jgi:outer membrane protein insertion porin family
VAACVHRGLVMWALCGVAAAQMARFEGRPIAAVVFEPEAQPLPETELRRILPLKPGDTVTVEGVRAAIAGLHATGRYSDIAVDAGLRDGGVVLRFLTRGSWFVGRVRVDGVREPPNQGQLVGATKLQLGAPFHDEDVEAAARNLAALLEANGYFEAQVLPELYHDGVTQQVHIDFRVDSGPRADYARPTVRGVPAEEAGKVIAATRWRRFRGLFGWKSVTATRTEEGLDRVQRRYRNQDHLLARISLERMEYAGDRSGVRPHLAVERGPKVEVRIAGVKMSPGRLRQLVPIEREQSADQDLLREGQGNLEQHFQADGYFDASVTYESKEESPDRRVVLYTVDRGRRSRLVRLDISGNRYFDEVTIRERLNVLPATRLRFRRGRFSNAMLAADVDSIRDLYISNGFRDVAVDTAVDRAFGGRPLHLAVAITIREGPQWLVSKLELAGVSEEHRETVHQQLASVEGQPYSEANVAADRDTALNYYFNNGYPSASFEWSQSPGDAPHTVALRFAIEERQRVNVRGALVGGLVASDPEMVRNRIRVQAGEPLSQSTMIDSQRRLYDLGVFARVDMAVQNPEGEESSKYVLYQFEEARKYSLNLGVGAEIARIGRGDTTFDAPAGAAGFSPRISAGIARSNMFGIGHTLSVQSRLSTIQRRALATYLAPQFKGRDNVALSLTGLYDFSRDVQTFTARRRETSAQISQRLSRANSIQYRFAYRRVSIDEGSLAIDAALIPIYSQNVRVGIFSGSYVQDRRDDPIDTRRGYYNTIDFGVASKAFASQTDYTRLLARNATYHRIGGEVVLARSLTVGWQKNTARGGDAADIPLAERFYSGGGSSHRGFPDNHAGPRDLTTGFPLGGSALLANILELRFPVIGETVGGVAFHDAGNVYARFRDISLRVRQRDNRDFAYMVHAVGFGLRYRTPIGPIRLDLAYVPNSPRFFGFRGTLQDLIAGRGEQLDQRISRFQFHFSLGQTF